MSFEIEDFDDSNKMYAIKKFTDQLDYFTTMTDCKNRIVLINEKHAKLCGFNTSEEIMSKRLTISMLNCPIAELGETFDAENKSVIDTAESRLYLTNAFMSDKKSHLCYGRKNPIVDLNGNIIGVGMLFTYLKTNPLINLTYALSQSLKYYQNKKNSEQFSFSISNTINEFAITPRQSETLFYLLRGKSSNEIAAILKRSPRTIEKHIEALKLAFNCSKKSELIEKAFDSGCLNYIPKSFIKNIPRADCIL